jgi:hypothetical protein
MTQGSHYPNVIWQIVKKEAELRIFPVRLNGIEQSTPCKRRPREIVLGDQYFHESDPVKTTDGQNKEHMIGG